MTNIFYLNIICKIVFSTCWYSLLGFAELVTNVKVMIDKARCVKHVSNNSLIKFGTKTIRNEKVPQERTILDISNI